MAQKTLDPHERSIYVQSPEKREKSRRKRTAKTHTGVIVVVENPFQTGSATNDKTKTEHKVQLQVRRLSVVHLGCVTLHHWSEGGVCGGVRSGVSRSVSDGRKPLEPAGRSQSSGREREREGEITGPAPQIDLCLKHVQDTSLLTLCLL